MISKHLSLLVALLATHSACANLNQAETNSSVQLIADSQSQGRLPAALEAKDCGAPKNERELPNDRFVRKGGRESKASVRGDQNLLTADGIEQGRDLHRYERLDLSDPAPRLVVEMEASSIMGRARTFLWEHWRDKKAAYLTLTGSSVDATSTSHIFIEEDQTGRWRVAWRIVRHTGHIDDLPTYYSVEWVRPAGWNKPGVPLALGEKPDPMKNELEFRDKCGDFEQSL